MLFKFKVVVKDDERAFLTRDGRFERLLGPGRFMALDYGRRLTAEVVKVVRAEIAADKALLLAKTHPQVAAEHFEIVQHRRQRGRHRLARRRAEAPGHAEHDAGVLEDDHQGRRRAHRRRRPTCASPSSTSTGSTWRASPMVVHAVVEAHEAGLLFVDGKLTERLPAGRHAFWAVGRTVKIQKVDTRPTPLEVTAQEILTKDRVGIRVTLTAFTRVVDPEKAALAAGDVSQHALPARAVRDPGGGGDAHAG